MSFSLGVITSFISAIINDIYVRSVSHKGPCVKRLGHHSVELLGGDGPMGKK
jgi:hypothetical protein